VWFFLPHFYTSPLRAQLASFAISDCNFWNFGASNIPLEGYFKDLSNNILLALDSKNFSRKLQKKLIADYVRMHKNVAKKIALDFECVFFLPCFVIVTT